MSKLRQTTMLSMISFVLQHKQTKIFITFDLGPTAENTHRAQKNESVKNNNIDDRLRCCFDIVSMFRDF